MKRSPSDMLLQTPTQTVRTVERDLTAAKRAAAREVADAEREIMALKRQVAAQQADAKMLAGCRESIENLRKEKAEMKIELDAAKNTAIAIYNCAVTLQGRVQRAQDKEAWLLKKAKKYKRALKKVGAY
jgi:HAMP domain-containing protein